jgi:hypothetical protein
MAQIKNGHDDDAEKIDRIVVASQVARDRKIDERLTKIEATTAHLDTLPDILRVLKEIKTDLLEPAVGKKQIPLSIGLTMIAILGALLVFEKVQQTGKDVAIGTGGLKIGSSEASSGKIAEGAER